MQLLPSPRDADEDEPPLLLELVGMIEAALVGKDAVLHGDHVDHGKLETLGGVERHERDAVAVRVPGIGVAHECRRLEKAPQRVGRHGTVGINAEVLVELPGGGHELVHVRHPIDLGVLLLGLGREMGPVARPFQHLLDERSHRPQPAGRRGEFPVQPGECHKCPRRPGGQAGDAGGRGRRLQPAQPPILGPGGQPLQRLPADAPRRHVDDAEQRLVVPRIAQQP